MPDLNIKITVVISEGNELIQFRPPFSSFSSSGTAITLDTESYLPVELVAQNKSLKNEFCAFNCNKK